jgi:hypothetical protein
MISRPLCEPAYASKITEVIFDAATAGPNVDAVLAEFAITAAGRVRTNHRINFVAIGGR